MPRSDMDDLKGRHALVCGASSGIGRAAAMALAARGATVTALARRRDRLDALALELKQAGAPHADALPADLDEREELEAAVRRHIDEHGPVHILINNAGGPPGGRLLDVADEESFMLPFGRLVLAAHRLVRICLPGMEEAGYGRIINIISTSVREPIPNLGISNTIRGATAAWAKTISKELPPGITINSVLPGFTDTERLERLKAANAERQGVSEEDVEAKWLAATPEGRLGQPEELGAAIAFLASPSAAFVRGVCLPVDGGRLNSI